MGNRAVICTKEAFENNGVGVYLHWNGGRDSIEPFLKYCEMRGFRGFDTDYGVARFIQVVANFFGYDGLSIGVDTVDRLDCDNGDNGVYIVDGWSIIDRIYAPAIEQSVYKMIDMLKAIDEAQPVPLGEDYFDAVEVDISELKLGDIVYVRQWDNEVKRVTVLGFGDDRYVNGTNVKGKPFVDIWANGSRNNINNYLIRGTVRKVVNSGV